MNGTAVPDEAYYSGNSMRGIFVPGEKLRLADETPFEQLRAGDVAVNFGRMPYIVHRVVGIRDGVAVTMGDNNDRPDAWPLNPSTPFRIVTGVFSADGTVRPVAGGEAGMRQFRSQQRKRKTRRFAGCLVRPLRPLKILRLPARRETRFRDGTVQWSFAGIPVAARGPSGRTMYLHWSKRLFFRVPERVDGKNGKDRISGSSET